MAALGRSLRRVLPACGIVLALVLVLTASACGGGRPLASTGIPTTAGRPGPSSDPSGPLSAPAASPEQDGRFLAEVTEADPALVGYEEQQGEVALRALLTDGSAFCALLGRGGGVDTALVDLAVGARSDEAQTHLPLSVTTFNAVEAVALLTLCPSEQLLLPASDRSRIRALGAGLSGRSE